MYVIIIIIQQEFLSWFISHCFLPLLFIRWKVPLLSQLIGWLTLWSRNCDVTVLLLTADVFNQSADLALHLTTTTAWHIRRKSFESAMCVGDCEESDSGLDIITPIPVLYGKKAFENICLGKCQPYKIKGKRKQLRKLISSWSIIKL